MIDVHNHILFGVDDGSKDFEETKEMLELACLDGIQTIIATPHYGSEKTEQELINVRYKVITKWIDDMALPIKIYLGNEILLEDSIVEDLENGKCMTLANSKYVLIEFYRHTPVYTIKHIVFQLCIKGYMPIIAHCERLVDNKEDLKLLEELKAMGCLLQVNASKVIAPETRWQRKWIFQMLKEGAISFVASDAHNCTSRQPKLKEAYKFVHKKLGDAIAQNVFIKNQEEILKTGAR